MLNAAASNGLFSNHPRCKKLSLTHCFDNDLMVFTAASPSSLLALKTVLEEFYIVSGLRVNCGKSEIFSCRVSVDMQTHLVAIVGLQKGVLPVRYLDCAPLMQEAFPS